MSLTSFLKSNTEHCIEFQNIIKDAGITANKFSFDINSPILVRYKLRNVDQASLVGTACDYMIRFYILRLMYIEDKEVDNYRFVAKNGLDIISDIDVRLKQEEFYNAGLELIDDYIMADDNDIESLEDRLVKLSIYYSKLDFVFRSGRKPSTIEALKYHPEPIVIDDVKNVFKVFKDRINIEYNFSEILNLKLNPSFGMCSYAVGGADCDLILNDELIEIKTVKNLNVVQNQVDQLVGYYLFSVIEGFGEINKISIYFARHGLFASYEFTKEDKLKLKKSVKRMNEYINRM